MNRAGRLLEQAGIFVLPAPIDEISHEASSPEGRLALTRWIAGEWLAQLYYAVVRQVSC
jgi:hypothetical protein